MQPRPGDRLPAPLRRWARRVLLKRRLQHLGMALRPRRAPVAATLPARGRDPDRLRAAPVSERLYERLADQDVEAVEARLDDRQAELLNEADDHERKRLTLAFGVHHGVAQLLEKTGLSAATPPEDVHAMGRGSLAAGGAYYYADLVVDALARTGAKPGDGARGLDFGCSSGRVVRVLAAACPELEWAGCDPIASSIAWATEHLPGIDFRVSPQEPPLTFPEAHFDFAFAISIWSHFAQPAAMRWLDEMARVVRPAGHLVLTAHGYQSIAHYRTTGERWPEQLAEIESALYSDGFWYAPEFGEQGDHGVVNLDWGTAFFTTEWLLAHLGARWSVVYFARGRAEDNQDLYVLERRQP